MRISINPRYDTIQIIRQTKVFCWQKITESSCSSKGTVGINIFTILENCDTKIMHLSKQGTN